MTMPMLRMRLGEPESDCGLIHMLRAMRMTAGEAEEVGLVKIFIEISTLF
jgi:hypothetical protein